LSFSPTNCKLRPLVVGRGRRGGGGGRGRKKERLYLYGHFQSSELPPMGEEKRVTPSQELLQLGVKGEGKKKKKKKGEKREKEEEEGRNLFLLILVSKFLNQHSKLGKKDPIPTIWGDGEEGGRRKGGEKKKRGYINLCFFAYLALRLERRRESNVFPLLLPRFSPHSLSDYQDPSRA